MSELYMYACPNCGKMFKVNGSGKRTKCSSCSNCYLFDTKINYDEWNTYSREDRERIKREITEDGKQEQSVLRSKGSSLIQKSPRENVSANKNVLRIIHCADIHLDSKMTSNLDKVKAKERKSEILHTFLDMIEFASKNRVSSVIIAGDLFDTKNVTASTRNTVLNAIRDNMMISFFYLKGNHGGGDTFLEAIQEKPENLFLFDKNWKTYEIYNKNGKRLTISGIELCAENKPTLYSSLKLNPNDCNIVTMHGQISKYANNRDVDNISIDELKGKNIDYLALGHVHEFQTGKIPPRGQYCYCGCLEGRGFDECGKHGFVLLEVDTESLTYKPRLFTTSKRNHFEIPVDVTGCNTNADIRAKVEDAIKNTHCESKDLVKVILKGDIEVDSEKNIEYLTKQLLDKFYFAKVKDETKIAVDYNDYAYDASLKGEFVRLVQSDQSLDEDEKAEIIRCGIQALNGEEIDL